MRITCPSCHAEASLDVLVGREADARAVSAFLARHVQLGDVLLRYVALFRPAKRRLGLARMVALIEELMPDIERGAIARKGRDWPAPPELWRAAIEQVLANNAKGSLTLPLSGHGYLHEVLQGMSDKAEGQAEREAEGQRRGRAHVDSGPVKLQAAAAVSALPVADKPSEQVRDRLRQARANLALNSLPLSPSEGGNP
jgi:hypothetical protein